jgi:hypothetical protein
MIVRYNTENPDLMGSWLSSGWNALTHATKVNAANVVKAGKSAVSATQTNLANLSKAAGTVWNYTPAGIIQDAITGEKNPVVNAIKVNTTNAVKAAKKISMNKIIDAMPTSGAGVTDPAAGESGISKYLPIIAAGVGALTLLM